MDYVYEDASKNSKLHVSVWRDAAFSDDSKTRKSTRGNLLFKNIHLIPWNLAKTKFVALSTTEAEFTATAAGLKTGFYLKD